MAQLDTDGFESGDKSGFDGTYTAGSSDTDSVQSSVANTGTYSWEFAFATNDYNSYQNHCYFNQSLPAGSVLWMKCQFRLDSLAAEYAPVAWTVPLFVSITSGNPYQPCAGVAIDQDTNYLGVWIYDAGFTEHTSFGTTSLGEGDSTFHAIKLKIDDSGSDPILTVWLDGVEAHTNTFTGVTLPSFNQACFGYYTLPWGDHDIHSYIDDCETWDSDPDAITRRIFVIS